MNSKEYPFDTNVQDEDEAKEILKQKITREPHGYIHGRSSNMNEFIDFLLQKDPNDRPTIKEVLEHPFIKKFSSKNINMKVITSQDQLLQI